MTNKEIRINLRTDEKIKKMLENICERDRRSITKEIEQLIIERHEQIIKK